jgi:molybdopterin/thiamine biosynthesis adenylyltransferase
MKQPRFEEHVTVVVVGAGGNVGSQLIPHLARLPKIDRIAVIDKDVYEVANLSSQEILPRDVGRRKVTVQARKLREIRPDLEVVTIHAPVETVPLGKLRADIVLTALDSRRARQHVNESVCRLAVPWIDAGVDAGALLVRVSAFMPGPDQPCMECTWDERDYAALEQRYSCHPSDHRTFSTDAPSSLGALAAALMAMECGKILSAEPDPGLFGRQILVDARHYGASVTRFRRNADCRLADHSRWRIQRLDRTPDQLTIGDALELGPTNLACDAVRGLRVGTSSFVTKLACSSCGKVRSLLRTLASLDTSALRCRSCGEIMTANGFDLRERLETGRLNATTLRRTLRSVGLRPGDVFTVGAPGNENHFELADEQSRAT